ncbi:MAG: hypothetical protein IPM54_10330 [Polyangiaceae bacterium]|nr:hypothetical protein [Polyangiaceae bacterium]
MATYSAAVEMAITGALIKGKGFADYLEQIFPGLWILRLDAALAASEFVVTATPWQILGSNKHTASVWKVQDPPPPRPPGMYLVVALIRDGIPTNMNFDVVVNTLK